MTFIVFYLIAAMLFFIMAAIEDFYVDRMSPSWLRRLFTLTLLPADFVFFAVIMILDGVDRPVGFWARLKDEWKGYRLSVKDTWNGY